MFLKKTTLRSGAWFSVIAMAASLAACGGSGDSSPPDPLQSYREQALQWAACDASILGKTSETIDAAWEELGDRLQCSTMRAPMDWTKPERSDVFVGVMRVAASDPAQRQGAVLFNPGGPGGDGLGNALRLFLAFNDSNPDSAQGAMQLRLLASYDMVGFSPRGTGVSTRLNCATNELERFVDKSFTALTDANLANSAYNDRKIAEACLRNPLTPYVNSDATARDMDLLRQLLGEDKLNYVGYSYGTWLGGWYASLFPDRVGRMVLDSSMDFTSNHEQSTLAMVPARQRMHQEVLLPYAARHDEYFHLGATAAEIDASTQALSPRMQSVVGMSLGGLTYGRKSANEYLWTLNAARVVDRLLQTSPDPSDDDAMEEALEQYVFVPGDSERDAELRTLATILYARYYGTFLAEKPASIQLAEATYWAVSCNDTSATTDPKVWNDTVRRTALAAPLFFGVTLQNPCVYWGGPRVNKPDVAAMKGVELLMVQSQYDAATPTEGADRFFAQLPNARRVYVPGEYQHGVFPYVDSCVDSTVVRYLLGETPKERQISCQAHSLEQDEPVASDPSSTAPAAAPPPAARTAEPAEPGTAPSIYLNPERAQTRIDRFKEGIGRRP